MKGFQAIRRMYEKMSECLEICDRAVLSAIHNGGANLKPSSPCFVSAIHQISTVAVPNLKVDEYQRVSTDSHHILSLIEAKENGYTEFDVNQMHDSLQRDYCLAEGIKHIAIFFVSIKDQKVFYLSAERFSDKKFTETEIFKLQNKARQISNEINS